MNQALCAAASVFLQDIPWFVLCCVPFMPQRKISGRIMVLRIFLVAFAGAAILFVAMLVYPEGIGITINIARFFTYLPMLLVFRASFDVGFIKLLYVFLLEQGAATMLNLMGFHITTDFFGLPNMMDGLWQAGITLVCIAAVYPLLWRLFATLLRSAMQALTPQQTATLCLSPALFALLGYLYALLLTPMGLSPIYSVLFGLLIILTGFTANLVAVKATADAAASARLEAELAASRWQLELESRRYAEMAQSMEAARAARHDARHHITVITGFAERQDAEGLARYLESWRTALPDEDAGPPLCNNHAVDVLVRHYLARAKAAGVRLDVKLNIPAEPGISAADLSVVFGNLFENAAQSCERQVAGHRFIRARCVGTHGRVVLAVDNSTGDTAPGNMSTGQRSVLAVAEKYDGAATFTLEDGVYKASVLLESALPPGEAQPKT